MPPKRDSHRFEAEYNGRIHDRENHKKKASDHEYQLFHTAVNTTDYHVETTFASEVTDHWREYIGLIATLFLLGPFTLVIRLLRRLSNKLRPIYRGTDNQDLERSPWVYESVIFMLACVCFIPWLVVRLVRFMWARYRALLITAMLAAIVLSITYLHRVRQGWYGYTEKV